MSLLEAYSGLVSRAHLERDPAQWTIIAQLEDLRLKLERRQMASKSSALGWMFAPKREDPPQGLYIWGSVGRGKTMLMDLFFEGCALRSKKRVHFHAFMADVHVRIHAWRQGKKAGEAGNGFKGDDPIAPVAQALAQEARLLCFDEFAVTDIADAMILGRLFQALWADGVVVVATSNVVPSELYAGGLNRALFLPFIRQIEQHMDVLRLDARTDFRLEKLKGSPTYHVPANLHARGALDAAFLALTGVVRGKPKEIDLLGRRLHVPQAASGVARFAFSDLCEQPLGAPDFLALARSFHTLIIDNIRVMRAEERNVVKRFITLIDALYDQHVKLIVSAGAEPMALYVAESGREAFEFDRTASRLIEIRSVDYLALAHGHADSASSANSTGLVET